jgi:hypothetical protein
MIRQKIVDAICVATGIVLVAAVIAAPYIVRKEK